MARSWRSQIADEVRACSRMKPKPMEPDAMTDPTPTRAEVEHHPRQDVTDLTVQEWAAYRCDDAGAVARRLLADNQALRERVEAAESECARLKNIRSAIAEGYNAEAVALEKSVSETITAQLTAARRAEAAAWNDAIEAADKAAIDRQGRRAMGDGHGNSCYDIGVSDAASAIRALRRAAPTEGAMRMETGMEHIARDIREGRFPERSEPQMRPAAPTEGEA